MTAHLAVELDGAGRHPAAWRLVHRGPTGSTGEAGPAGALTAGYWVGLAALAESAGLDFLAVPDSFVPPEPGGQGRLDAVAIAARIAPSTSTIGLVPGATTTHTEPFHLSKAIATLDFVSQGRAGWQPEVSRSRAEAELFGRKDAAPADVLWREAAEATEVVVRLWDSWEDDAVIRDVRTGRYVDRDKLHYLDFAGEFFSVRGPSITPRSPQARPPVVLRLVVGTEEAQLLPLVGRWAQVVRLAAPDLGSAAAARGRVRDAVAAAGRDPDGVTVLLDVETLLAPTVDRAAGTLRQLDDWAEAAGLRADADTVRAVGTAGQLADLIGDAVATGASDGVTLLPLALPGGLRAVADDLVPLLVERGLRAAGPPPGATLRERFGLARPANHFGGPELVGTEAGA